MNIFVAKLGPSTTGEDLRNLFSEYGEVSSAKVINDRETGNSKGYGFVEMPDDDEALEAIKALNDSELAGNKIVVKKANPKSEDGPRGPHPHRSGGGGFRPREGQPRDNQRRGSFGGNKRY